MEQSTREEIVLHAADGQRLTATWMTARGRVADAVCLIGPALAVPRKFYDDFGAFLTESGFDVLSLDFRGFGGSATGPLQFDRGFPSFGLDLDAAIAEAKRRSGKPLVYVGHSLGGHALGYASDNNSIVRAFTIASGSGYYAWSPFPQNALRFIFWTAFVPAITKAAGYYPGRSIGILGDIPKPVMAVWTKMCLKRAFFFPEQHDKSAPAFPEYKGELGVISLSDDGIMPNPATDELARNFSNARVTRLRLKPSDLGLERAGHFSALKKGSAVLWPAMARWLQGGDWRLAAS